jgi:hypothetical protein
MFQKKTLLLLAALLCNACANPRTPVNTEPAWVRGAAETSAVPLLSGTWRIDPLASDDSKRLIQEKIEGPDFLRRREMERKQDARMAGKKIEKDGVLRSKQLDVGDPLTDPRLPVLQASVIKIEQSAKQLLFSYDDTPPLSYFSDGQPVSYDGNINITLAEWENGQFVIEKNGPRGRILERWTLSPDRDRLHVQVQIQLPLLPETIVVNRQFLPD